MPGNSASCTLPDGTVINLSDATPEEAQACLANPGTTLRLEDPEPLPAPPREVKKAMDPKPSTEELPAADAAPEADAAPPPAPEAQLTAHEEQPSNVPATASSEIGDLLQSTGGGAIGIVAALIAVVGGTAGFKLWTKISEQKHDQQMKKLDIDQANAGLSGAQPPPCQAAHQTLVADIKSLQGETASLKMRLEKLEKKSSGFDPSVDVNDLEDRVEALEKSFRKKARTAEGTN
jgi:uncharacterized protein HemX